MWEAIEEATGFDISFQGASTANYLEKLNPKMNELDFPDIIWVDNSSQSFINWASPEQDLIWNLDELMLGNEDRYPYLTKLIYSDQYKNISYYDGGHYFVPNVNTATAWAIYYRADWLKEIGFVDENGNAKAPVTLDEFEQVMEGFTAKNKFGNPADLGYFAEYRRFLYKLALRRFRRYARLGYRRKGQRQLYVYERKNKTLFGMDARDV